MKGQLGQFEEIFEFFAVIQNDGSLYLEDENGEVMVLKPDTSKSSGSTVANDSQIQAGERQVFINQVRVEADTLNAIESEGQFPIADGRYWYDFNSGAWGVEDGPTAGLIYPGLSLPGPMPVNISGGGTGIYINGREIHPLDQQAMTRTMAPGAQSVRVCIRVERLAESRISGIRACSEKTAVLGGTALSVIT